MRTNIILICVFFLLLLSCSLAPDRKDLTAAHDVSEDFLYASSADSFLINPDSAVDTLWWHGFEDSTLNAFIDTVLEENLDLRVALKNIEIMEENLRGVESNLFPSASASMGYSRGKQMQRDFSPTGGMTQSLEDVENFNAGLDLSYVLDLTGRVRNGRRSLKEGVLSSRESIRSVYAGVISQAVITWYQYRAAGLRLALAEKNLDAARSQVDTRSRRYAGGVGTFLEYEQARSAALAAEQEYAAVRKEQDFARVQLSVLSNQYPGKGLRPDKAKSFLQATLPSVPLAVPSRAVLARPDVRAARHTVERRRLDIGVARAGFLPTFTLTGSVSNNTSSVDDLFSVDNFARSIGGQVAQTLFQGGKIKSDVDKSKLEYAKAVLEYRQTVLLAFKEIEQGIVQLQETEARVRLIEKQHGAARNIHEELQRRYLRGLVPYDRYLDARESMISLEMNRLSLQVKRIQDRINLAAAAGMIW
ncbi:MAG: efflux transporter outer membrane subunit [Fibrobacterota bacterium]